MSLWAGNVSNGLGAPIGRIYGLQLPVWFGGWKLRIVIRGVQRPTSAEYECSIALMRGR